MMKHGKHRGAESELKACAWLLEQGYEVFRNVSAFGVIDIVAIKDGVVRCIDVKSTAQGSLNGTAAENEGVEILFPLPDGGFRFRKKQSKFITRERTPRELILQRIAPPSGIDGGR
jgi:hypothetical protein